MHFMLRGLCRFAFRGLFHGRSLPLEAVTIGTDGPHQSWALRDRAPAGPRGVRS